MVWQSSWIIKYSTSSGGRKTSVRLRLMFFLIEQLPQRVLCKWMRALSYESPCSLLTLSSQGNKISQDFLWSHFLRSMNGILLLWELIRSRSVSLFSVRSFFLSALCSTSTLKLRPMLCKNIRAGISTGGVAEWTLSIDLLIHTSFSEMMCGIFDISNVRGTTISSPESRETVKRTWRDLELVRRV